MYDPDGDYKLLFVGEKVNTLAGTSIDFALWKNENELGKDYKRIVFYLCKGSDYHLSERLKGGNPFVAVSKKKIWLKKLNLFR